MTHLKPAVALAAILLAAPASAQVAYNQPQRGGGYGGGLIEFLMTGPQPAARLQAYPARARLAGLPSAPQHRLVEREPDPSYRRQLVDYEGGEAPGTIVVDTEARFLFHVRPGGRAMRYGIGVGRPGFEWAGMKTITMKREWPDWRPPAQMLARRPDLPRHMAGGPDNPLGARALYLGSSLYRIHGTNEPNTIGQNVSSGCIRMMNEDVVELYDNVRVGTRVKVI